MPPAYVKKTEVAVSKNTDLSDLNLGLGSLIEYRKGVAVLVGVIILGFSPKNTLPWKITKTPMNTMRKPLLFTLRRKAQILEGNVIFT